MDVKCIYTLLLSLFCSFVMKAQSDQEFYNEARDKGIQALSTGEYKTALSYLKGAKRYHINDNTLDSWIDKCNLAVKETEMIGDSLYKLRKYDLASEQYRKLIDIQISVFYKIGNCFNSKGEYNIASDYYNKSILAGELWGAYLLANLYRQDLLGPVSEDKIEQLYMEAAKVGYLSAMDSVAMRYDRKGKYSDAIFWFKKTVDRSALSQYKLACYYFDGLKGLDKGFIYLVKSAKQDYLDALYYLGLIYINGSHGINKNETEGWRMMRLAADKGYLKAKDYVRIKRMIDKK